MVDGYNIAAFAFVISLISVNNMLLPFALQSYLSLSALYVNAGCAVVVMKSYWIIEEADLLKWKKAFFWWSVYFPIAVALGLYNMKQASVVQWFL